MMVSTNARLGGWLLLGSLLVTGIQVTGQTAPDQKNGQHPPGRTTHFQDDRQPVRVRYPAAGKLQEYRNNRDYQYRRSTRPPDNSLRKFWNWLMDKIAEFFRSEAYRNVWQYIILAVIAVYAVYLLIKAKVLGFLLPSKAHQPPLLYEQVPENIHEINFGDLLDEAIGRGNYRLAVRLLYLQTLKNLSDRELINWKPDKTNRQYVYELNTTPLKDDFASLTTAFEYAWYGDFPVDQRVFDQVQAAFTGFNKQLPAEPRP